MIYILLRNLNSKKETNMNILRSRISTSTPIFPIGFFSSLLNINQRTLRIYDKKELLIPKRNKSNRRLYSLDDYYRAKLILFLTRNLLVNLSGVMVIHTILNETNNVDNANFDGNYYINYLEKLAGKLNITKEAQNKNQLKASRKGRKK